MKNKKSQGLPINAIVLASLAMVVLVVILVIFTNVSRTTAKNIGSCETKGGICADKVTQPSQQGQKLQEHKCGGDYPISIFVSSDCENTNPKNLCCIKGVGKN